MQNNRKKSSIFAQRKMRDVKNVMACGQWTLNRATEKKLLTLSCFMRDITKQRNKNKENATANTHYRHAAYGSSRIECGGEDRKREEEQTDRHTHWRGV